MMEKGRRTCSHFYRIDKFELLEHGDFWLSETPENRASAGMRFYRESALGDISNTKIPDLNFSFQSPHGPYRETSPGRKRFARTTKMKEIGENLPAILTGDFNVDQTHRSYLALTESGILRDAFEVADLRYATNGTFNGFDSDNYTESRIDHVFVTPTFHILKYGVLTDSYRRMKEGNQKASVKDCPEEISIRSYESRIPSDHFPVMVKLEVCDKN